MYVRHPIMDFFGDAREPNWLMKMDKDDIVVEMELPGFSRNDVTVDVSSEDVKIAAKKDSNEIKRRVSLPIEVNPKLSKAEMKDGLLTIRIPALIEKPVRVDVR